MRHLLLPVLALLAAPALAQDAQEERDRGFLAGLIEDNLSAPGLAVRIDGFEGALSSEASLEALTISDDEGAWLRLEDVVLDWNRSALLRGRLEVEALTAGLIRVERAPLPAEGVEALPDAGAGGFSLPTLPVSVDVEVIRADRIELGAPLLGQELAMTLEASARLADGSGAVSLQGQRLDGVEGVFDIDASYDAGTTALDVDLRVEEAEGGIAATLLQLPGAPAIALTVRGEGPLDDFAADVTVASDGEDRLAGAITLTGVEGGRRFDVDIGGDVTSLFAPRYRPFFGDDVGLRVAGLLRDGGGTDLEALSVDTRALSLDGSAAIGADGWPTLLDVEGRLASQDGGPVLLPTSTPISVAGGSFVLRHDASESEDWRLVLSVDGLTHPVVNASSLQVSARGEVAREAGAVTGAAGEIAVGAGGLAFTDPSLQDAVGSEATLTAGVDWAPGAPVRIEDLRLRGPALEADGSVAFDAAAELPVDLAIEARVADLSRVAALAGLEALDGAAELSVDGGVALGGAFDVAVSGAATGLVTGIEQADGLLEGRTSLAARARRDPTGTYLEALDLSNPQVSVSGSAAIYAEDAPERAEGRTSQATLAIELADGSVIDPRLAGRTRADVSLGQTNAGVWTGNAAIAAPQGVELSAAGTLTGPAADVEFSLSVPEVSAFVEGIPGGVTAKGRAFVDPDGIWQVDADATGPWDLTASVAGAVTGDRPEIDYTARLPDPTAPVPALEAVPALAAPVELSGTVAREGGSWVTDTRVDGPEGIVVRASGPVTGPAPRLDIAVTVPEVQAFAPQVEGALSLDGTVARAGEDWTVEVRASGPYGSRATVETVVTDVPLAVDFSLAVPELSEIVPAVPGGLDVTGMAVQAPEGWQVDVTGTGPYDAALDVQARLPEAGPEVDASVVVPDASAIAGALEGALTVDARARQRDGAWSVEIDAAGPYDATLTARASLPPDGAAVTAALRVPDVAAIDPRLEGALTVDVDARQVDGVWEADLDAAGPLDATVTASARLPEEGAEVVADVRIPDSSLLSPRLEGPLTVDLDATRTDGVWRAEFDAAGPLDATATGTARVGAEDAEVDFALRLPDSAVLAPQLSGPLSADVTARQVDGAWEVDLDADGPFDAETTGSMRIDGGDVTADVDLNVPDSSAIAPQLSGPLTAAVDARLRGAVWTAELDAEGPFDAETRGTVRLEDGDVTADLELDVPDSSEIAPELDGPLSAQVAARRTDGIWTADVDVSGPSSASTTGTVRLVEGDVIADLDVSVPDTSAILPQLDGPLEAQVDARQSDGVWDVGIDATGPFAARTTGTIGLDGDDLAADLDVRVPDASRIAPQLQGPLDARIEARRSGGVTTADVDASGPFGGTATASYRQDGADGEVQAALRLPDASVFAPQLRGPLTATVDATQRDGVWRADLDASGPLGGSLDVSGVVAGGPVDVEVALSVPDVSPIAGDISGPLRITGGVAQEGAAYRVDLDVVGPAGTQADVAGTVGTDGTLGLSVAGSAPLGLANGFVEPRRLSGTARFDLTVSGPPSLESVTGTVSTQGAALSLPTLRNGLEPIDATIRLTGGQAVVDLTANVQSGGRLTVEGPVDLAAPFAADLRVAFDGTVSDPNLYTAEIDADIAITGPLTGGGTISGEVVIPEAEIAVPSTGITAIGDLPPIDHLATPRPVQRTLARAGQDAASRNGEAERAAAAGPGFTLNLVVRAPGRIFVRGRGLDAELGGQLRLTGTTANPITAGGFELVRGRLDILQQRFDLDEGSITFQGDLVPFIRLVAVTQAESLTASIVVEGPADDIEVGFESSPDAPEEEILAQIFFGRDLSELSPLQALQLANSVAVLAGRGSGGLLERLRGDAGLDDLDVTTDAEGNTAVRAGKYVSDNVYTTVEVDQEGDATVSLNLDLTPNLTIRGTTGAEGESSLGVFFERDY